MNNLVLPTSFACSWFYICTYIVHALILIYVWLLIGFGIWSLHEIAIDYKEVHFCALVCECKYWLLFENRPALYFCNYKKNKKNNIRMLDTLFIEDFIDSMEEYFHF